MVRHEAHTFGVYCWGHRSQFDPEEAVDGCCPHCGEELEAALTD